MPRTVVLLALLAVVTVIGTALSATVDALHPGVRERELLALG